MLKTKIRDDIAVNNAENCAGELTDLVRMLPSAPGTTSCSSKSQKKTKKNKKKHYFTWLSTVSTPAQKFSFPAPTTLVENSVAPASLQC